MGHVAASLDQHLVKNCSAQWLLYTQYDILKSDCSDVKSFAKHLASKVNYENYLIFTNDPKAAVGALSCLIFEPKFWVNSQS